MVGSGNYTTIMQLNADLLAAYPDNFVDLRAYIVSQYDADIAQDVIDYNNDITPTSLRVDDIHLNANGNSLAASYLYNWLESKGWIEQHQFPPVPERAKYNITPISNPEDTTISDSHTYSFASSDKVRQALGWMYGVDHWAFTNVGVPKAVIGAIMKGRYSSTFHVESTSVVIA